MRRGAKNYIILILVALALYGIYWLMAAVLGLSLFMILLTYAAIIAVFLHFNRKNSWAMRGNYFYITGNFAAARPFLEKAVAAGSKSPAAHIYLSLLILQDGRDTARAFKLLEDAREHCVTVLDERNLLTTLATCQWLDGQRELAVKTLTDMRQTQEYTNAAALTTLGYMHIAQGDFDAAREVTLAAIKDEENYGAAWDNMGQICYQTGDMAGAKEHFTKAVSIRENLADANFYLGLMAEAEGDADAAKEHFRKAAICTISFYNAVTEEQIQEKYKQYHEDSSDE